MRVISLNPRLYSDNVGTVMNPTTGRTPWAGATGSIQCIKLAEATESCLQVPVASHIISWSDFGRRPHSGITSEIILSPINCSDINCIPLYITIQYDVPFYSIVIIWSLWPSPLPWLAHSKPPCVLPKLKFHWKIIPDQSISNTALHFL